MKTTGNLGLKKPDGTDIVDIADINGNMDILDTAVKAVQDHAIDTVKHITAAERTAWNAKASTAAATSSTAGLMAAADKAKLDGVATGANNYVHPNHTGDVTSTGDGVTAIAAGVIVDADVNSSAAISWSKINKTGSSLADLTTRSAGDLSSGTLAAARLPAISGDITMAAGAGTAAITAGAIVNADVNAAAAIDASKIGTGVVSNAEFAYLDGVTSGIQGQLDARPQQTTANITYYVRTDGSDSNTGLVNTTAGAFKTINKAISVIPQNINHTVVINVSAGTYAEDVVIGGFLFNSGGRFNLNGAASTATTHNVLSVKIINCYGRVEVIGLNATTTTGSAFMMHYSKGGIFSSCSSSASYNGNGFDIQTSDGRIIAGNMSNKTYPVWVGYYCNFYVEGLAGSGNVWSAMVDMGAKIAWHDNTLTSTNGHFTQRSGEIITAYNGGGILNPWGDNTSSQRSAVHRSHTFAQTISANVATKVSFAGTVIDQLTETDSTGKLTVKTSGIYVISASVSSDSALPIGNSVSLIAYVNGAAKLRFGRAPGTGIQYQSISGTLQLQLNAGDYVEIYILSTYTITTDPNPVVSYFQSFRGA